MTARRSKFAAAALVACGLLTAAPGVASAQTSGLLGSILGCDAPGGRQETGALLGALLGGVGGNQLMREHQGLATAAGAALGAAAGSYLGCKQQRDRALDQPVAPVYAPAAPRAQAPAPEPVYARDAVYREPPATRPSPGRGKKKGHAKHR